MHMNAHSAAGASIALAIHQYVPVPEAVFAAAPLAVLSHCLMDKMGEPSWGRTEHTLFDGAFMAVFMAIAVAAGPDLWWVIALGWFFGNLPDIWDKRGYLSILNHERWPARRDWFCHFKGYEAFKPSGEVTTAMSVALMGVFWWLV
jgi:hypothetical protein